MPPLQMPIWGFNKKGSDCISTLHLGFPASKDKVKPWVITTKVFFSISLQSILTPWRLGTAYYVESSYKYQWKNSENMDLGLGSVSKSL